MTERSLLWAYGVVPASQPAPGVRGIEGRAVAAVTHGGLAALASTVPAERFAGEALQQRLEDLETVAELARAHDSVLEAAMAGGDVVPFRMCTIYETRAAIERMLAAEASRFARLMARLHDKAEWGVKAFVAPRAGAADAPRPSSGIAYLARRRAERDAVAAEREAIETAAAEVHTALAERATSAVLSRPHDRRLSGRDQEMLLNGAYLLERRAEDDFARAVESLARTYRAQGLTLELTGPWPPYHFVVEAAA
jgi:hypothetical protein